MAINVQTLKMVLAIALTLENREESKMGRALFESVRPAVERKILGTEVDFGSVTIIALVVSLYRIAAYSVRLMVRLYITFIAIKKRKLGDTSDSQPDFVWSWDFTDLAPFSKRFRMRSKEQGYLLFSGQYSFSTIDGVLALGCPLRCTKATLIRLYLTL